MSETRVATLRRRSVLELCGASARALAGDKALHFRGEDLYRGAKQISIHAPHLRLNPRALDTNEGAGSGDEEILPVLRAVMDGVALRTQYSDSNLYRSLYPSQPFARLVFEMLEQLL